MFLDLATHFDDSLSFPQGGLCKIQMFGPSNETQTFCRHDLHKPSNLGDLRSRSAPWDSEWVI